MNGVEDRDRRPNFPSRALPRLRRSSILVHPAVLAAAAEAEAVAGRPLRG
jgi:hypothetical protein